MPCLACTSWLKEAPLLAQVRRLQGTAAGLFESDLRAMCPNCNLMTTNYYVVTTYTGLKTG